MSKQFKVPEGMTEGEVLLAIEKSVRLLAPSFVFSVYDVEDVSQQARLFGIEGLEAFDNQRQLAPFLYAHIRNRLINFRRDHLWRNDPPCKPCHTPGGSCQGNQKKCSRYTDWFERNSRKANVACPVSMETANTDKSNNCDVVVEEVSTNEILLKIDEELAVELRGDYLQMRAGLKIPLARQRAVLNAVKNILDEDLEWPAKLDL